MRRIAAGVENRPPAAAAVDIPRQRDAHRDNETCGGSPGREGLTGCPVKESPVCLILTNPDGRQVRRAVILKVYATSFGGRYAVVSQDKALCKDGGYVNLRYCTVKARDGDHSPRTAPLSARQCQRQEHIFDIVSHRNGGQKLAFSVQSRSELDDWLSVLEDPEELGREDAAAPKVVIGSPTRRYLGELSPTRLSSPRLGKKQTLMPAVEEE